MKNNSVFPVRINFGLLLKKFLLGAFMVEIFILAYWGIGLRFTEVCGWNYVIITALGTVDLCIIVLWILNRGYLNKNYYFYQNIDLVIAIFAGMVAMHYLEGVYVSFFIDKLKFITVQELIVLLSIPAIFFIAVAAKKYLSKCKEQKK